MAVAEVHHDHRHEHGACYGRAPVWRRSVELDLPIVGKMVSLLFALAALVPLIPGYPGVTCPLRALIGIPCPFCGTTTSIKELGRLDIAASLAANPVGIAAVLTVVLVFVTGRSRLRVPTLLLIVLLLGLWIHQLHRFSLIG